MTISKICPKIEFLLNENIIIRLNSERKIHGKLRGYDQFMNLVLDETILGCIKKKKIIGKTLVRGSSILGIEVS
jgi:small nuclear ribonucleoprotein (snRNP)-like protein